MQTVIIAISLWVISSVPIGLLIGRAIHQCEAEEQTRYNCHI